MIINLCAVLLFSFLVIADIATTRAPVDLRIDVIIPVCIVAGAIILGVLLCYCFCNRSDYERIEELCTSTSVHGDDPEHISVKAESNFFGYRSNFKSREIELCTSSVHGDDPEHISAKAESNFFGYRSNYGDAQVKIREIDFPKGIKNIGSECYMNSAIQALASSDTIVRQFQDVKHLIPLSNSMEYLLELLDGINSVDSGATVSSNTKLLSSLIREIGWNKSSQQDSFEFLSCLVNAIYRDLKQVTQEFQFPLRFELVHRFSGHTTNDRVQFHIGLSIGLCGKYYESPGETLEYLILQSLTPIMIDDNASITTQMIFYKTFPEVLILHIQANKMDPTKGEMIKPKYFIQYSSDLYLDLPIVKVENSEIILENVHYTLSAVIIHIGDYRGDHYMTYRNFKGLWFVANDDQVNQTQPNYNLCPYILIYVKNESS